MAGADPRLVEAWLRARSVGRGLPQPVHDHGGLRVDTATATEDRRYVFCRPVAGLRELARSIRTPRIALKLAGTREEMIPSLPARWRISPPGFLMTREAPLVEEAIALRDYRLDLSTSEATITARILGADGQVVCSGHAVEFAGVFAYDRIETHPAHRRRGLGRALMTVLGSARRSHASIPVLVATVEGHALYTRLGWSVHSPWTTALIPDADA